MSVARPRASLVLAALARGRRRARRRARGEGLTVAGDGASHREAPLISMDPGADITDFFMFRSYEPGKADRTVLIMDVMSEEPSSGPNYWNFDPNVVYSFNIDNDRDGEGGRRPLRLPFQDGVPRPDDAAGAAALVRRRRAAARHRRPRGRGHRPSAEVLGVDVGRRPAGPDDRGGPDRRAVARRAADDAELRRARRAGRVHAPGRGSASSPASVTIRSSSTSERRSTR